MKATVLSRCSGFAKNAILAMAVCSVLISVVPPAPLLAQKAPQPAGRPMKLVLARQSTTDPVEIMKHLSKECPNITITTNPKNSDYMLYAGGWPGGGYRFMVIAKGGDTIYATETTLLSNAVKDVCKFLNTHP